MPRLTLDALTCCTDGCESIIIRARTPDAQPADLRAAARACGWSVRATAPGELLLDYCRSCTHGVRPVTGLIAVDLDLRGTGITAVPLTPATTNRPRT